MDLLYIMAVHVHIFHLLDIGIIFQIVYFAALFTQEMGMRAGLCIVAGIPFVNCQCLCSTLLAQKFQSVVDSGLGQCGMEGASAV